jgi:hypothetical protein
VEDLGQAADKLFRQHPELRDHHQLPGVADSTGAPVRASQGSWARAWRVSHRPGQLELQKCRASTGH